MNTSRGFQQHGPIPYTSVSQTGFRKKWRQGFRKKTMRNGEIIFFALLNLRAQIEFRVATFDTNHYVTDSTQTINRCFELETS
jgi:hypothetical protein